MLRDWPGDTPPDVPGVSLKMDDKAGGWIFARKHTDAVQAAIGPQVSGPEVDGAQEDETAVEPGAVAAAAADADPAPTDGQKEAENYRTGKASWNGLRFSIENAKGAERSGTDESGKRWSVTMPAHYGRILGTEGADGDHVDFYMGDDEDSDFVLVIDQKDADTGKWDEHKVILGTRTAGEAIAIFDAGFSDGRGMDRVAGLRRMSVAELKEWLADGDTSVPVSAGSGNRRIAVAP